MPTYQTEFCVSEERTIDEFSDLLIDWMAGIQGKRMGFEIKNNLKKLPDSLIINNEHLESIRITESDFDLIGLRYNYIEENEVSWTSEIVASKSDSFYIHIRVNCDAGTANPRLPYPKRPYIVKKLCGDYWQARDAMLPIINKPLFLRENEVNLAAELIGGQLGNTLPIVYLSSTGDVRQPYSCDPINIARDLFGIAHVVTEPNITFSRSLGFLSKKMNVYGGYIGIYWPNIVGAITFFHPITKESEIRRLIQREILSALSNRRPNAKCNWQYCQQQKARNIITELRHKNSTDLDAYLDAFEEEIKYKDTQLSSAEREIYQLKQSLSKRINQNIGSLNFPSSQEFYADEFKSIIIDALNLSLNSLLESSRRYEIVSEFIKLNEPKNTVTPLKDEIKSLFKSYDGMTAKVKSDLSRMGFEIRKDGGHYKLLYAGNPKYTFTIPATPGDHRGGKNIASDICKILF